MSESSRDTWIGVFVSALAVGTLAIDHLIGTEDEAGDSFPVDTAAFAVTATLSLALALFLFGVVVRRGARDDPERAAKKAITYSLLAIAALPLLFAGLPFPLAGAGIALGVRGREGARRGVATAAIAVGALVLALGTVAYLVALLL